MKVAIIGASFAKAAYLPALRHVEGAEVVAIASERLASASAAAAEFGVAAAYDDWRLMLENHKVDLVCIATPTDTHAEMTLAAIAKGAAVLCEKPMAMDAQEAQSMLDAAEAAGVLHMIDHELRFNPNRQLIKTLIDNGDLGEIHHASISNISTGWGDRASRSKGDWWSDAARGGGRLGANGSHQTDLIRWLFGEVRAVSGQALTMMPDRLCKQTGERWSASADDYTQFTLDMHSGPQVNVMITAVARHGLDNSMQIFGSKGSVILDNSTERLLFGKAGEAMKEIQIADPNADLPGVNKGIWNVSVVGVLRELCGAIAQKRALSHGATFLDGLRNQQVLDAVLKSHKERRWIDL